MKHLIIVGAAAFVLGMQAGSSMPPTKTAQPGAEASAAAAPLRLGNFSVSLTVKDIAASKAFYENLGFKPMAGNEAQKWLIMQNDTSTIGLFQGMFPKNTLTFNPGWDRACAPLADFDDVREIQKALKARGVAFATSADEASTGPASFMVMDPDGNPILVDQHVAKPQKK